MLAYDIVQDMEDIAEQLAIRDRFRRNRRKTLTPSQRMAEMDRLQQRGSYLLSISPEGYARFLRRNFKARATDDHGIPKAGRDKDLLDLKNLSNG